MIFTTCCNLRWHASLDMSLEERGFVRDGVYMDGNTGALGAAWICPICAQYGKPLPPGVEVVPL